ncbi:hypothetical protein BH11PAT1_BH11PAT1_1050 [soil metagenome]
MLIEQWELNYSQARENEHGSGNDLRQLSATSSTPSFAVEIARGSDFSAKLIRVVAQGGELPVHAIAQRLLGDHDELTLGVATEAQIRGLAHTAPFLSEGVSASGKPTVGITPEDATAISNEVEWAKKDKNTYWELTDNQLSPQERETLAERLPSPPSKFKILFDNLLGRDLHPRNFHPEDTIVKAAQQGVVLETNSETAFLRGTNMITEGRDVLDLPHEEYQFNLAFYD